MSHVPRQTPAMPDIPTGEPSFAETLGPGEFLRRLRWARRQGRPRWLWPDVTTEAWRAALRQIEEVVRARLSGAPATAILGGDAAAIGLACYTSGTGPLLGWWQDGGTISATSEVARMLARHLDHNRRRFDTMTDAVSDLVGLFERRRIAVAVLKGAHTAHSYFPHPGTRPASDVDLLVHHGDAGAAEAVMRSAGYDPVSRTARESAWRRKGIAIEPRSLMLAHAEDPWTIDLHISLDVPVAGGAPAARLDALRPMESCARWAVRPSALVLDQPQLLLHLAVHAGAGLHNLTLIRLIELHLVIRQDEAAGRLCWDRFVELGEAAGLLGYAFPALALCEGLAPGTIPATIIDRCRLHAPTGVRRVTAGLTPASAQRIDRTSFAEHFMWAPGWRQRLRQLGHDVSQPSASWRSLWSIYETRAWQILRGAISR